MAKVKDLDSKESRLIEDEIPGNWDEILMVAEEIAAGDQDCTCSPVDMVPGWPEEACGACVKASDEWDAAGRPGEWGFPPCEEYDEPAHFPDEI